MQFDKSELERIRQWFDGLFDMNPEFLDNGDFEVAARLYEACGMRKSAWLKERLTKSETKMRGAFD